LELDVPPNSHLIDLARERGLPLIFPCGGKGECGRCRLQVTGKQLPAATRLDEKHLDDGQLKQGCRLACCLRLDSDCTLGTQPASEDPIQPGFDF
jgi:ferredoxin